MLRINLNLHPHSGYVFKDSDGTTLAGANWAGVIARVRAYRKRAGLPPGDPWNEVKAQVCQREPSICNRIDPQTATAIKVASLKGRVLQWFSSIRKATQRTIAEFASSELATQRANICAGCPHNQSLPDGCASCKAAVRELRIEVIGGRAADNRLVNHGCTILGAELATQAWLEQITVDNPELPGHCWRKRGV